VKSGMASDEARARRKRLYILVALFALFLVVWLGGAYPADRHAESVAQRLRRGATQVGLNRLSLPPPVAGSAFVELERASGTAVSAALGGGRVIELRADASQGWTFWQHRCVLARVSPTRIETRIVRAPHCYAAAWPG